MSNDFDRDAFLRKLLRACGFAIATAECGLAGRITKVAALEALADEIDDALRSGGIELRALARLEAYWGVDRNDN